MDRTTKTGKVYIRTYGCQMNLADSETVMALLEEVGYRRVERPEDAGTILVNTCIVREHAEEKALTNIAGFEKFRDADPEVRIGVLGCMASGAGERVAERLPFLAWILGPDAYRSIPNLLAAETPERPLILTNGTDGELYDEILPARREGINAWVVITRGCSNFCTYCVVPYARGAERHRPVASIIREVEEAVAGGYSQVTLLGQNVNSWHDREMDFPGLLRRVARVPGLKRLRFITSHPKDCSVELLDTIASGGETGVLCPELHLPVQSGSDRILARMGRKYTRARYLQLVELARARIPGLLLSTDIIAGFPGESEDDFRRTEELVREVGYGDAFVYKYSVRPGTAAAKYDDDVPEEMKVERLTRIGELVRESGRRRRQSLIGETLPVMVEGVSSKSAEECMGRSPAGDVVVFPGSHPKGETVNVRLESLSGYTLRGIPGKYVCSHRSYVRSSSSE